MLVFSLRTALTTPLVYLDYATLTDSTTARRIILGPFAAHVQAYVIVIAIGQAAIAAGLCLRGLPARIAGFGAVAFLVAVAPLGVGAGFPSTLIMAGAMALLLRTRLSTSILHAPLPRTPVAR